MKEQDKINMVAQMVLGDTIKDFFKANPDFAGAFIEFANKRVDEKGHPTIQKGAKQVIKATVEQWVKS